jgi:yecA family protein
MTTPVSFDAVERALASGGAAVHAAEAHGCLCGALCARRVYLPSEWLEEILADPEEEGVLTEVTGALSELYESSGEDLASGELDFSPLLPGDEAAIEDRVGALSEWCQGFLYGIGASGTLQKAALSDEVQEFLTDVAELTRVDVSGSDAGEAEEEAYVELVEYVRMGVQLIYDELAAIRAGQPANHSQH